MSWKAVAYPDLQCLDGSHSVNRLESGPERNTIGRTPRASSEQVWDPNGNLECKFLSKTRTGPTAASLDGPNPNTAESMVKPRTGPTTASLDQL
jgi:hypothetical protein